MVFGLSLILAGAVYVWFFPLNKGTFELNTDLEGYRVLMDGEELLCTYDPCNTRLKTGEHLLLIQKEGYTTISENIWIDRGKVTQVKPPLKRIYILKKSETTPQDNKKPSRAIPDAFGKKALAYVWNEAQTRLIFLDKTDERIKIGNEQKVKPIALLKNITPPLHFYWSSNEKWLLAQKNNELYFIDIIKSTRHKKILDFEPQNITWGPGEMLMLNKGNELFHVGFENQTVEPANMEINLSQSVWSDDETLLYFVSSPEKTKTEIKTYNPGTNTMITLTVKFDLVVSRIEFDKTNKTAYFKTDDNEWYELKL